ncbi:MAG: TIGR03936 family radical SAM-associated protein, partial [Anaerolineales bacterium]|nr:TIGR03936 family radical SAM-associated protein [Anaerolineales bacterium]
RIRRAGLPLSYSHGFHPQPKIQLAAALALGFISHAELVDIWLDNIDLPPLESMQQKIQAAVPTGIRVINIREVELRGPALQTRVHTAEYLVTLLDEIPAALLDEKLASVLAAESIIRERRKRRKKKRYTTAMPTYDLRPLILALETLPSDDAAPRIYMRLAAREGATGRPDEVLAEIGIPVEAARVERTQLLYDE